MIENKNELREETIEFALEVSDICEKIKGYSVYTNQLLRSSSSIGLMFMKQNMLKVKLILLIN